MVATAVTSVTKLRTTPDVNVPDRLPNRRVLLLCWSQSSLVKTVRLYRRDASEYGTSPLVSMFRGSAHVAGSASASITASSSRLRPSSTSKRLFRPALVRTAMRSRKVGPEVDADARLRASLGDDAAGPARSPGEPQAAAMMFMMSARAFANAPRRFRRGPTRRSQQ